MPGMLPMGEIPPIRTTTASSFFCGKMICICPPAKPSAAAVSRAVSASMVSGSGLPAVRITDIRISANGSLLRVSTYGRGVWEIYPNSEPPVAAGTGDFDRTKVVDFFNLASLAARMGSTPAATSNLVYDSAVDLDGSSTIDDLDVAALTAKFGGAP